MIRSANFMWMDQDWQGSSDAPAIEHPQLILVFGDRLKMEENPNYFYRLRELFPSAHIVSSSTAGEIMDRNVHDECIIATALQFEHTRLGVCSIGIAGSAESTRAGRHLVEQLMQDDLVGIVVLSDGHMVNGSDLVKGLYAPLAENNKKVLISGGLAGDGSRFQKTLTGYNEPARPNQVVAIGLYGDRIRIGNGSIGGWDPFGVQRQVTRSVKNVLYELDNMSALELYKEYLGELASELPSSALLFPLEIISNDNKRLVRTVLSVNEQARSMTFAGDIPMGSKAQLMKANFDRLIDGAGRSAEDALSTTSAQAQFALLISCVGRKIILGQRVDEEVEEAAFILSDDCAISGFYSYGEISPLHDVDSSCELHNQTMTITTFSEI